jgi:hypothetical protein
MNQDFLIEIRHRSDDVELQSNQLAEAYAEAYEAGEELNAAKVELARATEAIIRDRDPKELGSNEAQRNATIAAETQAERDHLLGEEYNHREAQHSLALAQLAFDTTKLQIRLLEAASRFAGSGE